MLYSSSGTNSFCLNLEILVYEQGCRLVKFKEEKNILIKNQWLALYEFSWDGLERRYKEGYPFAVKSDSFHMWNNVMEHYPRPF